MALGLYFGNISESVGQDRVNNSQTRGKILNSSKLGT